MHMIVENLTFGQFLGQKKVLNCLPVAYSIAGSPRRGEVKSGVR